MNLNLRVFVFLPDNRGKTYQELDLWLKEHKPADIHSIWQDANEVRIYYTQ